MIATLTSQLHSFPRMFDAIPGHIGLKDLNSRYIAGNTSLAKLIGFKHPEDLVGITDFDIKGQAADLAPTFVQQDKTVLESGDTTNIDVHYYADSSLHMLISHKAKLFDDEGNLAGTIFHCTELQPHVLQEFFNLISGNYQNHMNKQELLVGSFSVDTMKKEYKLTRRESECLFFLLRGKPAKEISRILDISEKTVWYYLDEVKQKLQCHSRSELFDACIQNGLFYSIPFSILNSIAN